MQVHTQLYNLCCSHNLVISSQKCTGTYPFDFPPDPGHASSPLLPHPLPPPTLSPPPPLPFTTGAGALTFVIAPVRSSSIRFFGSSTTTFFGAVLPLALPSFPVPAAPPCLTLVAVVAVGGFLLVAAVSVGVIVDTAAACCFFSSSSSRCLFFCSLSFCLSSLF